MADLTEGDAMVAERFSEDAVELPHVPHGIGRPAVG